MKKLWHLYHSVIPDHMIQNIHETAKPIPSQQAVTGYNEATAQNVSSIRKSEVKWIDANRYEHGYIVSMIMQLVKQANRDYFGFDIDYINDVQYTTYYGDLLTPGHYDWHSDIFWEADTLYQRKLSFVCQLSDPSEYEGGNLLLDQQYTQPPSDLLKAKGSVIVFPSFLKHKVTPVTYGIRRSLVSWVEGPNFK